MDFKMWKLRGMHFIMLHLVKDVLFLGYVTQPIRIKLQDIIYLRQVTASHLLLSV